MPSLLGVWEPNDEVMEPDLWTVSMSEKLLDSYFLSVVLFLAVSKIKSLSSFEVMLATNRTGDDNGFYSLAKGIYWAICWVSIIIKMLRTLMMNCLCINPWFRKFYFNADAPWCPQCRLFAPEYAKAAAKLKEDDSPIRLAKFDPSEVPDFGKVYDITLLPTIKFFRKGEPIIYTGITQNYINLY